MHIKKILKALTEYSGFFLLFKNTLKCVRFLINGIPSFFRILFVKMYLILNNNGRIGIWGTTIYGNGSKFFVDFRMGCC